MSLARAASRPAAALKRRAMTLGLKTADPDFEDRFRALLAMKRESAADVNDAVAAIIAKVRAEGDAALIELTLRFDGLDLTTAGIRVGAAEIEAARDKIDVKTLAALELAHARILDHHQRQLPADDRYIDELGVELGQRWTPVASAGLYVPGGTASYPSSVLMNAVPAKVARVKRVVMVVPAQKGALNPLVLAAASLAGVDEIYRVGGAQAIAALAYGTESIAPVAKIVGPGNAYVAAAKRQVYGQVGIDMVAGPSEVVVIADKENDPAWIAVRPARPGRARRGGAGDPHHRRCSLRRRRGRRRRGRAHPPAARDDRARELARLWGGDPGQEPRRGARPCRPSRARAS